MAARFASAVSVLLLLAACGPAKPADPAPNVETAAAPNVSPTPAPQPPANTPPAEPLDPFVVMIDAERWTVLLDKALDGTREHYDPAAPDEADLFRADAALKRGAAMVIQLRNETCRKALVTGAACALPEFPAWTREPPTAATPIDEIDRRSQWLSEVMGPFTDAGCEAGRKATKDDMFCSVE